ncbi:MAG TPA: hypothetical protein PLJ78_03675 [Anaerolineae bacterium]|nr:hypothetical protein [Anaerolineae bacterium]HQK13029.1 hypothetical protein [Anaerolineae bacterium]
MAKYLLMVLGVLFLYRRLVAGWGLAGGDLQMYFFPYWTAAARALQAGRLPLWNPDLFAGAPLLANSQAGVFYPLNWLLWWIAGPSLEGMARTLHWSVWLHLCLAAVNVAILARCLGMSPWSAALSGLLYAGSGYLGVHVEHLNQLQGLAWLPLVFLPARRNEKRETSDGESRTENPKSEIESLFSPVSAGALALIILAGHTQMAFIAAVGYAFWVVGYELQVANSKLRVSPQPFSRLLSSISRLLLPLTLAALIAAAQLLPTLELMHFSPRSGGLPWREAVSFSVRPWELPRALLPPYLWPPLLPEAVAYIGLAGMALAGWGAWRAWRHHQQEGRLLFWMGVLGVFLALGGYNPLYLAAARLGVPGIAHFRAPARFLALYVLSAALLAGMGFEALQRVLSPHHLRARVGDLAIPSKPCEAGRNSHWIVLLRRLAPLAVTGIVFFELLWAAERMPHADATALRAYTDLRPATAHLVAAARADATLEQPPGRFLSLSPTLFEIGDKAEIEAIYGATLSPEALWAYEVAVKQREVLAPNLPMAFAVPAVDGYDGGLLPLRHYVTFSRLFLPEGTLDGRLRENLTTIPEGRWLSLLGVRFLMTDKTGDAWADDVFYDRQFQPHLRADESLTLAWLPADFEADTLGWLYSGRGEVRVTTASGVTLTLALPSHTADAGAYRLPLGMVTTLTGLSVRAAEGGLTLTGASLIDARTGAFYPLVLSEDFRLVHSGDVKIYENLHSLPRAFLVREVRCAATEDDALALMRDPTFDPRLQAVIMDCAAPALQMTAPSHLAGDTATVVRYAADKIVVDVTVTSPALLVLTDAWYPGWQVEARSLDMNQPTSPLQKDILRTDILFRGVMVEPGAWRLTFSYRTPRLFVGIALSLLGSVVLAGYMGYRLQLHYCSKKDIIKTSMFHFRH